VRIKSSKLYVLLPPDSYPASLPEAELKLKAKLESVATEGGELLNTVIVDDSTWSVEKINDGTSSTLTVTLCKATKVRWSVLFK
jgi:hypothetical protein